jgi:hypothetical protein
VRAGQGRAGGGWDDTSKFLRGVYFKCFSVVHPPRVWRVVTTHPTMLHTPVSEESLRVLLEDESAAAHTHPEDFKTLVHALAAVVFPRVSFVGEPAAVDPSWLGAKLKPHVLQWLGDVLPGAVFEPRTTDGVVRDDAPYWMLRLTYAVLQWRMCLTPTHPVFGDPSDGIRGQDWLHALWFKLPAAIEAAAPLPGSLSLAQLEEAVTRFYRDGEGRRPWVRDFSAPGVRNAFLRALKACGQEFLLAKCRCAHTCKLLARLTVEVGSSGELKMVDHDDEDIEFAQAVLRAGVAMLSVQDFARDVAEQALEVLCDDLTCKRARIVQC